MLARKKIVLVYQIRQTAVRETDHFRLLKSTTPLRELLLLQASFLGRGLTALMPLSPRMGECTSLPQPFYTPPPAAPDQPCTSSPMCGTFGVFFICFSSISHQLLSKVGVVLQALQTAFSLLMYHFLSCQAERIELFLLNDYEVANQKSKKQKSGLWAQISSCIFCH